ncbi:MFS general substrate transporter [Sistotremastrum niveocremeum HHB9708]|uniref:MFS general substrate transporter n=1 Tax=Sistotremastrum niveocremeum HHB9708 TaxID=1314777 RepID=A0A164VGJ3_9AGAM|nr:MFS general substrate transporter [Sistotremastrum niveocremeum HHB9708]
MASFSTDAKPAEQNSGYNLKNEGEVQEIEHSRNSDDRGSDIEKLLLAEGRVKAERHLVRKLDCRLLPCIVLIFIMNYVDRTAITSARLKGLEQDLHLTDLQFDTVIAILYASYCPAQIPSNMILNKVKRPSLYIGICVVLWGITSASTAATKNYAGILLCRVFIGLPEAAFYPGAIYLLSRWYTRKELAFRSAILYGGLLISNAFGSLMAAGILSNMEGKLGIRAWRWLFIIEGSITCFIGFCSMYILPDYPQNTRWMSPEERLLAQVRLSEDAAEADEDCAEDSAWTGFKQAISDPKVPIFAVMTCSQLLGLSFVNFFPTLTSTLGFNTTVSLLLAAPPWIFATMVCLANAWHCDRSGERFFHIAGPWWGVILGFIISLATRVTGARYVSMFLMASGYAGFALTLVWVSNAIPRPPAKRAAAIGIVNGFGNIGNLIGSYAWKAAWSPFYHPSMWISLSALLFSSALALVIRILLKRENKRMDRDEIGDLKGAGRERIEEAARLEGISFEQALERKRGFRYLY